mgnify:CR=1 FL=1
MLSANQFKLCMLLKGAMSMTRLRSKSSDNIAVNPAKGVRSATKFFLR